MADIPEQWGIPTNLVMSILWVTSWVVPLQPKVAHNFPFCIGSVLLGPRALVYSLGCPVFSFFSSISVFSFLFSCCRWTITLWRWLGKEREGQELFGLLQHLGFPPERADKGATGRRAMDIQVFRAGALILHRNEGLCVFSGRSRAQD